METGSEPFRRWGQKTGVLWVGAICAAGRQGLLSLSPAKRESFERGRAGLGDWVNRGLRPPAPSTTAGARGLTPALEAGWPTALGMRGGFHQLPNLQPKGPAQAWPEGKALRVDLRAAPSQEKAEKRRETMVEGSQRECPEVGRCRLAEAQARLNPRAGPKRPPQSVRPANLVERALVEERRRTTVIPHLWTEGSLVPLVFGVWLRVSARWGKKGFSDIDQQQMRS